MASRGPGAGYAPGLFSFYLALFVIWVVTLSGKEDAIELFLWKEHNAIPNVLTFRDRAFLNTHLIYLDETSTDL
jgi:hypothetical protein